MTTNEQCDYLTNHNLYTNKYKIPCLTRIVVNLKFAITKVIN